MRTLIVYVVVVLLSPVLLTIGIALAGVPAAFALMWTSVWLRARIVGLVSGVAGVATTVAFGCLLFNWVTGPGSFTLLPFLSTLLPLARPIAIDYAQARRVADARAELLRVATSPNIEPPKRLVDETETAHGSAVVGEVLGVILAVAWFFTK